MKKIILKGLTALFIVFLFGTVLMSCGPIFNVGNDFNGNNGDNNGGDTNPPPPGPPADGYKAVKAFDGMDLADYLMSDETSYAITLTEIEDKDIYLPRSISIVKPMKIIGGSGKGYTIHSTNRANGIGFYCLDLQADLELEHCGFTGYNGTSSASPDVPAGSPPLNIRAGRTLTMTGKDSVLELRGSASGGGIRTGSQVKLAADASIVDNSGDLLFRAGVEKLIVSGKISLNKKLTVGDGAVLQIENGGELRVEQGATLTLNHTIKELRLDGNIVVDRINSPEGSLVTNGLAEGTLLEKITGNGFLSIENGEDGIIGPLNCGVNTILRLSSYGINLGKRVSSDVGVEIKLNENLKIPKGKTLFVGAGTDLVVDNHHLTLEGGTLDVSGNVIVRGKGKIIVNAENKFAAIPKGSVTIGSNAKITIDNDGTFQDKTVSQDVKIFTFPSYGAGSLIITDSGYASMGEMGENGKVIIGDSSDLLKLTTNSSIAIRNAGGTPEFTLKGKGTLDVKPNDIALGCRFIIAGGAELTVEGDGILTVRGSNQLTGTTTPTAAQLHIVGNTTTVDIDNFTTTVTLGAGQYKWDGEWGL